jgi:hypothetical protein
MSNLGQPIHDYPHRVISSLGTEQSDYQIHSNFFPLLFLDLQWL